MGGELKALKALHSYWRFDRDQEWYEGRSAPNDAYFRCGWESILHELGHYLDLKNHAPSLERRMTFERHVAGLVEDYAGFGSVLVDCNELMAVTVELEMAPRLRLRIDAKALTHSVAASNLRVSTWTSASVHKEVRRLRKTQRAKQLAELGVEFIHDAKRELCS